MKVLSICILSALLAAQSMAQAPSATTQRIRDWQNLQYGMFIHYGMSTFTGNEHQKTKVDPAVYAPTDLDVEQWVCVARDAGMKYIVLTSKHTAGHCLWDSKVPWRGKEFDYDIAQGSDKTDVVGAFVKACRKHEIEPGLYYCYEDYVNNANYRVGGPGRMARNLPAEYLEFVKAQLTELLNRYPSVNYLWLDIPVQPSAAQRAAIYNMIKGINKDCIVLHNRGWGKGAGSVEQTAANTWPTEILNTELYPLTGSFQSQQTYRGKTYTFGYEHCDKIGKHWFWKPDEKPRPASDLLALYKKVKKVGGTLLLNVPPDRTGRIPAAHVATLMELKRLIENPPPEPLSQGRPATASNVYKGQAQYGAVAAVDGDTTTRWATDDGLPSAWLEVDMGKPVTINRAVIQQAYPELKRVRKFVIEYRADDEWRVCYRGENLGARLDASFAPVTAQRVRLNITSCTDGPTIWEFQLF